MPLYRYYLENGKLIKKDMSNCKKVVLLENPTKPAIEVYLSSGEFVCSSNDVRVHSSRVIDEVINADVRILMLYIEPR